jgi:hypothetical protein
MYVLGCCGRNSGAEAASSILDGSCIFDYCLEGGLCHNFGFADYSTRGIPSSRSANC